MGFIDELKKIDRSVVAMPLLLFVSIVSPGYLVIFLYKPELAETLDVLKLCLFACSLSLPLLLLNICCFVPLTWQPGNNDTYQTPLRNAATLTALEFYVCIYVSYLWHLRFRTFSYSLIGLWIAFFLVTLYRRSAQRRS